MDSESNVPVENAKISIENFRYESDNGYNNYDEYLGVDNFEVFTDKKGCYQLEIAKSAFIVIEISKEEFKLKTESEYSSKYMFFKTILEKTNN